MKEVTRLVVRESEGLVRLLDGMEVPRIDRWIDVGDSVLVAANAYYDPPSLSSGEPGGMYEGRGKYDYVWATVTSIAPGSASTYPIKVVFGNDLRGQYRGSEIIAVVRNGSIEYWPEHVPED